MARHIRVPVAWLRAEAEAGRVPHLRAGTQLLFDPETVERVLLERAQQTQEGCQVSERPICAPAEHEPQDAPKENT